MVIVVSGCGSTAAQDSGKPASPRDELLLSESEFPAGSKMQPITTEQLEDGASEFAEILERAVTTPPECATGQLGLAATMKGFYEDASVAAALTDSTIYTTTVADREFDLGSLSDATSDKCADTTQKFDIGGTAVAGVTRNEKIDLPPDLQGDNVVAIRSKTTITFGSDSPRDEVRYQGFAVVRGMSVGVSVADLDGGSPDTAEFVDFFAAAVRKVENAK